MRVAFCGVRGSMPAAGPQFVRYGGHTSCLALSVDDAAPSLLLDAGTGVRNVGRLLDGKPFRGAVLIGHLHWDHVHGMPFFGAGLVPGARVDVHVPAQGGESAEQLLSRAMSPPTFPIEPHQLGAGWSFGILEEGVHLVEGFRVLAREIPHKGGRTFGYRVEHEGLSVAYLSDHDPLVLGPGRSGLGAVHDAARELADGVDLLVHDAHLTASELPSLGFLGHACAEYALELAAEVGARRVALTHHAWEREDDDLDALAVRWTGGPVPAVLAREGDVVDVGADQDLTTREVLVTHRRDQPA